MIFKIKTIRNEVTGMVLHFEMEKQESYCCRSMLKAIKERFILVNWDQPHLFGIKYNLNIVKQGRPLDFMQISCCPFCGEKIEINEVE